LDREIRESGMQCTIHESYKPLQPRVQKSPSNQGLSLPL
jgi:hypothetical protein